MSDKRISELVELTSLAADDELVVVDADANGTKRVTYDTLSDAVLGDLPGIGSNVVSVTKQDTFATSSTSYVLVPGLEATITPTSATSKVLIIANVAFGPSTSNSHGLTLTDDSGNLLLPPTSSGGRREGHHWQATNFNRNVHSVTMSLLHSPATTSAFTVQVRAVNGGGTLRINRGESDGTSGNTDFLRGVSTLTLIEVAG